MKTKANNENRLGLGHFMVWKSSEVSAAWVNLIILSYLSIYASDTLGLNVGLVGTILLVSKIIDAVTDVFAGILIDNTRTKLGKGRPYEICIVGMTICTVLLFSGSAQWSNLTKILWVSFMYMLVYSIFSTLRSTAQNVYTLRHFKYNRTLIEKQASYGGVFVMVFSIAASVLFPILMGKLATGEAGWTKLVLIFMVPATLIGVLRFIFCKEEVEDSADTVKKVSLPEIMSLFKNNKYVWIYGFICLAYNIITNLAVGSYYFTYIIGDISKAGLLPVVSIVILPIMLIFPALIKKFGSMGKMVFVLSWISVIGFAICFFANDNLVLLMLGQVLGNLGIMPVMYFGALFIMDICEYNESIGLPRMESCSGIVAGFATKSGGAIGSWITGIMLMLGGYISSVAGEVVEQPASALMMIRVDFSVIPMILSLLIGLACLAFSKLENKLEAIRTADSQ
ncbi:MAG: MFS transporter [Lachnospiraceae bacterium]|nr:MFS transporter [Lachnospiraceae bacterium]